MEEALVFANAAGALAATRPGAQESMPRREEVARLVREGARDRTRGAHETES
jgi:sugar/nucleoside kinase (ribokinase family)